MNSLKDSRNESNKTFKLISNTLIRSQIKIQFNFFQISQKMLFHLIKYFKKVCDLKTSKHSEACTTKKLVSIFI